MVSYAAHVSTRTTPQSEPIPGKSQVANSAGGYAFAVDCWTRLERFLILGNEGGSYYASERKLTQENAKAALECAAQDAGRTVRTIVEISKAGRAPKNDPAIFLLALLAGQKGEVGRLALDAVPEVCRIGTHLFQFAESVQQFRGWGRSLRRSIAAWYTGKAPNDLAYQLTKYQQRNGWSHRDLLRLSHPTSEELNSVLRWAVKGEASGVPELIEGFEKAKRAENAKEVVQLIEQYGLVREHIPTAHLNSPNVWGALLEKMPMTAMLRNLGKMSQVGLLKPLSQEAVLVAERLRDSERIRKARIHPLSILVAQRTYAAGRGVRGSLSWQAVPQITDALNDAFYLAFDAVEPTGKAWLLGVDVSGSMSRAMGALPVSCAQAAAAMAMVAARTEPRYYCHGFAGQFIDLGITPSMRLDDVLKRTQRSNFGTTDCSLPMLYALEKRLEVDVFAVYTDNETWCGRIHPCQALDLYRQKMGRAAKLIVCGMVANAFSIADPSDGGMLDCVGFSTDTPAVMADFAR